jgi:hypothetical protein
MSERKERLCTRVSPRLHALVTAAGARPGVTQAEIVEAALELFFSEERDDQRDAGIIRRLDRLTRQFSRLERNDLILAETVTLFMRFMFTITPPLPDGHHKAARALAAKRFDDFIDRLARQLAAGRRVLEEALEEIVPEPEDFASLADIDPDQPIVRRRRNGKASDENGEGRADV